MAAQQLITHIKATDDYYEILQIKRKATEKEIKVSYRKKALLLHPDRCQLDGAKDAFQKLSNAHMCLSDKDKRRRYDVSGSDSDTPNPFAGAGNPFAGFTTTGGGNPFAGTPFAGTPFGGATRVQFGGGLSPDFIEQLFRQATQGGGVHTFSTDGNGGWSNMGQTRRRRRVQRTSTANDDGRESKADDPQNDPMQFLNSNSFVARMLKQLSKQKSPIAQV